ncbi:hemagglutinin [Pseudorhodoferax sp.]|uniref:hemagglutinin n=1 Tax=Pseudorhodoferax sp. TaxID=1993553 RepID=UPI002DD67130|nr:hemagglutinin [Pseudorhodoferax sp.]
MAADARAQYEAEVAALRAAGAGLLAAGTGEEQVARWMVAQRNALKLRFRACTPADDLARLQAWTQARYGSPLGPSADQLKAAGKSWREIIEGAARPGRYRGKA